MNICMESLPITLVESLKEKKKTTKHFIALSIDRSISVKCMIDFLIRKNYVAKSNKTEDTDLKW